MTIKGWGGVVALLACWLNSVKKQEHEEFPRICISQRNWTQPKVLFQPSGRLVLADPRSVSFPDQ